LLDILLNRCFIKHEKLVFEMFCKVCFDASSIFDTHNVKDSAGNVICPLLLNTKCRTCGYFGHTTKYCKIVETKKVDSSKGVRFDSNVKMTIANGGKTSLINKNTFCMLIEDNEKGDEDNVCLFDDEIIWGVGLKSLVGKRWADDVEC
jgi:hypothetical protein